MAVGLGRKRKRRRRGWRAGMMRLLRQARRLSVAPIRKMRPADGKPGKLKPRRKAKCRSRTQCVSEPFATSDHVWSPD